MGGGRGWRVSLSSLDSSRLDEVGFADPVRISAPFVETPFWLAEKSGGKSASD
jgi:hypothetical protein